MFVRAVHMVIISLAMISFSGCATQIFHSDVRGRWVFNIRYEVNEKNLEDWMSIYRQILEACSEHEDVRPLILKQIRQYVGDVRSSSDLSAVDVYVRDHGDEVINYFEVFNGTGEVPWTPVTKRAMEGLIPRLLGVGSQWIDARGLFRVYVGSVHEASSYKDYYWPARAGLPDSDIVAPHEVPAQFVGAPEFRLKIVANDGKGVPASRAKVGKEIRFKEWQALRAQDWSFDPLFEVRAKFWFGEDRLLRGSGDVVYDVTGRTLGHVDMRKLETTLDR